MGLTSVGPTKSRQHGLFNEATPLLSCESKKRGMAELIPPLRFAKQIWRDKHK